MDSPLSGITQAKRCISRCQNTSKMPLSASSTPPQSYHKINHTPTFIKHMGQKCSMQWHRMTPSHLRSWARNLSKKSQEYFCSSQERWIQQYSPSSAPLRPNKQHLQKKNMKKCLQFLDYATSQDETIITYRASDMKLTIHSDVSYLSEPNALCRAGGHMFMAGLEEIPINNGAVLNISQIIKAVISLAAEAELGALFINAKTAVPMQQTLEEMEHPQPQTPIQTGNSTAHALLTNRILPQGIELATVPRCTGLLLIILETKNAEPSRLLDQTSPGQPPQVVSSPNSDITKRPRLPKIDHSTEYRV